MLFPVFSQFLVPSASRVLRVAIAVATVAPAGYLGACATKLTPTINYIRAGQYVLRPETVTVADPGAGSIMAKISVGPEDREIAVLASECRDGVGNIVATAEISNIEAGEVLAFARGGEPADKLFAAVCKIGLEKIKGGKSGG